MDDGLQKLLYLFLGLIWLVGPFVLRLLRKRRTDKMAMEVTPGPSAREFKPRRIAEEPQRTFSRSTEETAERGPGQRESLARRARAAAGRADDLERRCRRSDHGRDLAGTVRSVCVEPLRSMAEKLEGKGRLGEVTSAGIGLAHGDLRRLEAGLAKMQDLFERREALRDSKALLVLDTFIGDVLTPYILHARRVGLSTRGIAPVVSPIEDGGASGFGGEAGVLVSNRNVSKPARWATLASSCASAFGESCGAFFPRVCADFGLPDPRGGVEYFFASGRLTLQVLVSGWMPWIFGDVCGAVQLGPAFALGLMAGSEEGDGSAASIDSSMRFGAPPLHVRVFAAVSTLNRLGMAEEADRLWKNWVSSPGSSDSITLVTARFGEMALPADRVLEAVGQGVDLLLTRPLSSLGGYGVTQIDGLRCDRGRLARMERAAGALARGESPAGAPVEIMGAAAIASDHWMMASSKVVRAVESSILGEGQRTPERAAVEKAPSRVTDLAEVFSCRRSLAEVISISAAVAPVRGGRSSSGSV